MPGVLIEGHAAAKAAGATRYLGKLCTKDPAHGRTRLTSNGHCVACHRKLVHLRKNKPGPYRQKHLARVDAHNRHARLRPGTKAYARRKARTRRLRQRQRITPGSAYWLRALLRQALLRINSDTPVKQLHGLTTRGLFGCTAAEYRAHIEAQWRPGWTWKNRHSVWQIHHEVAVASYDGTRESLFAICHFKGHRAVSTEEHERLHAAGTAPKRAAGKRPATVPLVNARPAGARASP
jgi:hypothetical protein